jgi:hypothetical protein
MRFTVKQPQVTEITLVLLVLAVNFDFLRYFVKLRNVYVPNSSDVKNLILVALYLYCLQNVDKVL